MKNILIFLLFFAFAGSLIGQDSNDYMVVMVKQKKALKMARTEQDFQNLANTFERIANVETDQWHPLYYAALCYINLSFINKDNTQKDAYLDKAQKFIDKALEIYPDESEIYVVQALLHQGRIQIDRAQRGMIYSQKADESLNEALVYNPDNPRIYHLQGMNILYTPESFGGGAENACVKFKKADELFKSERPQHVLSPTWGGERNLNLYNKNCKESGN